jgi:DUF1680 family protein
MGRGGGIIAKNSTLMSFAKLGLVQPVLILLTAVLCRCGHDPDPNELPHIRWQSFQVIEEGGLLGERLESWRNNRLWYLADTSWLLSGFESRPGSHAWQGEHIGKWLHAATLAQDATRDDKLKKELDAKVENLLAAQLPNGYLGTYSEDERFYTVPRSPGGWDIWTHRYNLYGLLIYDQYYPDEKVLNACKKMADLLMEVYGPGKNDITAYGTRKGISSTCLIESMAMLYGRTHEEKYLQFAKQIVAWSEGNRDLRLMDAMLHHESVVYPGDGKAYQLMANLLGYYQLYLYTGEEDYLKTVINGWEEILENHILVTGGPWTRKMPYNANAECFARKTDFEPGLIQVENCCTVTWIQLNLHLFELTGLAKYTDEAEQTLFNQLLGAQHTNGIDWCYFTKPNEPERPFDSRISCCASSGPRALEMYAKQLVGEINNHLAINSLSPSTHVLSGKFGGGRMIIGGQFPFPSEIEIGFDTEQAKRFTLEFRIPSGTILSGMKINGKNLSPSQNDRGFCQVRHKWQPGDVLTLTLEYELKLHIQAGLDGRNWVAFSYGPMALSQEINSGTEITEPLRHRNITEDDICNILEILEGPGLGKTGISFGIPGTDITLIPYYLAGSGKSGPRTYFECHH